VGAFKEVEMKPAIEVNDLQKNYGDVRAVDGLSFEVAAGEIFGLLGPNGAGKTTTVECLLGLRQPDGGSIHLLGENHGAEDENIRSRIGVQLQTTGMLQQLSVREQVQLFAGLFPRAIPVEDAIEMVGLSESSKVATKALSGGQKQRLAVALALINDPDLIFLDEPTTGLDPQARRALWDVISGLRARGKCVLLTTHYMDEAEVLCDRVAIVDHGKIIEQGHPQSLIKEHFQETALEFSTQGTRDREDFEKIPGVVQTLFENGHNTLYSTDVPRSMAGLFDLVEEDSLTIEELVVRQATLEDVFLKLTGRRIRS
jgi:ABC-2 type transport system ATP-binding protein